MLPEFNFVKRTFYISEKKSYYGTHFKVKFRHNNGLENYSFEVSRLT